MTDPNALEAYARHKRPSGPWLAEGCSISKGKRTIATAWPNPARDDGSMTEIARLVAVAPVLDDLYASEINFEITTFWDGGWDVRLGDDMNGIKATTNVNTFVEAAEWLMDAAIEAYPLSEFAKLYRATA